MRTFIAVELPAAARQLLVDLQRRLERSLGEVHAGSPVRWTTPQNLHLTLRFLGETTDAQRTVVEHSLASLAAQPAFPLALYQLGCFPNWRRPNIVWVNFSGATVQLERIQVQVEAAVQAANFPPEERPFTPHLTIGRVKKEATSQDRQQLGEVLQREQTRGATLLASPAAHFTVAAVAFIQSDLRPSGPVYTPLAHYSLKG